MRNMKTVQNLKAVVIFQVFSGLKGEQLLGPNCAWIPQRKQSTDCGQSNLKRSEVNKGWLEISASTSPGLYFENQEKMSSDFISFPIGKFEKCILDHFRFLC